MYTVSETDQENYQDDDTKGVATEKPDIPGVDASITVVENDNASVTGEN